MKKIKLQRDLFWSFNGISEPNFWNFVTIFLYFLSHWHSGEAWGQLKLLMNPKNVIRVRRVKNMMKIAWICENKWKDNEFSYNLQKTISLDWNELFLICKNLESSNVYREYFRKIFKDIFHILRASNKPTKKKIRNFWPKILLWIEIFSNRGLLWLYGVWQNKAHRVPEHLQRVSLLDKIFIIIGVKGRGVSRATYSGWGSYIII